MKLDDVRTSLAAIGVTIRRTDSDEIEYRVNMRGGSEATAYYTTDLDDALGTGLKMAERPKPPITLGFLGPLPD